MTPTERAKKIIILLKKQYKNPKAALNFKTALDLLVATMLSAQCTDKKVNSVTKELFKKYKKAKDYAKTSPAKFAQNIKGINFYKNKAKNIINASKMIVEKFKGKVPDNMEDLVSLPGVARKTANIVLGSAYHKVVGIACDTHVIRLSQRLGLTKNKDPVKIEQDLMAVIPKKDWYFFNYAIIDHGRAVCKAKAPLCNECILNKVCPSAGKV